MRSTTTTTALVTQRMPLKDRDRLVTLFSETYGKIVAIARGTQNMNSRRAPHLDVATLAHFELMLYDDRPAEIVSCSPKNAYMRMKANLPATMTALSMLSKLNSSTADHMPIPGIFPLITNIFSWLDEKESMNKSELNYLMMIFDVKLSTLIGIFPYDELFTNIQETPFKKLMTDIPEQIALTRILDAFSMIQQEARVKPRGSLGQLRARRALYQVDQNLQSQQ